MPLPCNIIPSLESMPGTDSGALVDTVIIILNVSALAFNTLTNKAVLLCTCHVYLVCNMSYGSQVKDQNANWSIGHISTLGSLVNLTHLLTQGVDSFL